VGEYTLENGAYQLENGTYLQREPDGGGGGGGDGGTVAAGGDGTGTGSPGFESDLTTTKRAQADLGMDGSGGTPINDDLQAAAGDNVKIVFEPGEYVIDPRNGGKGMVFYDLQNFGIVGDGGTRRDVRFKHPDGRAGRLWNFTNDCDNVWWGNFVVDHNAPGSFSELYWTADGELYAYNIAHIGSATDENRVGGPGDPNGNYAALAFSMEVGGSAWIENYQNIEPPERLVDYPDNSQGVFAGYGNRGAIDLVNARIEFKGEHACYASRSRAPVRIRGGRFVDNANTNMRIAGSGSFIRNATVGITRSERSLREADTGEVKACRGLRVEANLDRLGGKTGGYAENCDFVKTSNIGNSSMLIEINGSVGSFDVRDCRIRDESADSSATVDVEPVGEGVTPPTPHDATIARTAFTGGGDSTAVDSRRYDAPTNVVDCCLGVSGGSGFVGAIDESGTSTSGCSRANL